MWLKSSNMRTRMHGQFGARCNILLMSILLHAFSPGVHPSFTGNQVPRVTQSGPDWLTLGVELNSAGTVHYVVLPASFPAPISGLAVAQFALPHESTQGNALACGSFKVHTGGQLVEHAVASPPRGSNACESEVVFYGASVQIGDFPACVRCPQLTPLSAYDVYVAVEDGDGVRALPSHRMRVVTASANETTGARLAPRWTSPHPTAVVSGRTYVVIGLSADVDANATYAVLPRGVLPAPAPAQILGAGVRGSLSNGTVPLAGGAVTEVALCCLSPATLYTLHVAASYRTGEHGPFEQAYVTTLDVQTASQSLAPQPTLTASFSNNSLIRSSPAAITATFDRPVSGFVCVDRSSCGVSISGPGAVLELMNPSGDQRTYIVLVNLTSDGGVVVRMEQGAAVDTYDEVSSLEAIPFAIQYDGTEPAVELRQVSASQRNMIFRIIFSEDVFGFQASRIALVGCTLTALQEIQPRRVWEASTTFVSPYVRVRIASRQVYDAAGNTNSASNDLEVIFQGHKTSGFAVVAGHAVPFGGTVCLTPRDLTTFQASCPLPVCSTSGCVYAQCDYDQVVVEYEESNDGLLVVEGEADSGYQNALLYDGELMHTNTNAALHPGSERTSTHSVRYYNTSRAQVHPRHMSYWAAGLGTEWYLDGYQMLADASPHNLSLVLDYGRSNVSAGSVQVRYCEWEDTGSACGCGVDLTAGHGLVVGGELLEWSTVSNSSAVEYEYEYFSQNINGPRSDASCIKPEHFVRQDGADGVVMQFTEMEALNMIGYSTPIPAFSSSVKILTYNQNRTEVEVTQTLLTTDPKVLRPGESRNTSVFVPASLTDEKLRRLEVELDATGAVSENNGLRGEANVFALDFVVCGAADLLPVDGFRLVEPSEAQQRVEFGGEVCVTPRNLLTNNTSPGDRRVRIGIIYNEANIGSSTARPAWQNSVLWDGAHVSTTSVLGPLAPSKTITRMVVADLGIPDQQTHTLSLVINANISAGGVAEANYSNNQANVSVRFCGWGAELSAGDSVRVGGHTAAWGSSVCLTDGDVTVTQPRLYCSEGGCFRYGSAKEQVYISYNEVNLGPQAAYAGSAGWSNVLSFDGENDTVVNSGRPVLQPDESRQLNASDDFRGVAADLFEPFDFNEHTLQLRLDAFDELHWVRSDFHPGNYSISIKFCMQTQIDTVGRCGCSEPDLTAGSAIRVGTKFVEWGGTACLSPQDLVQFVSDTGELLHGINIEYTESNVGRVATRNQWTNQLFYDGVQVITDARREGLNASASRTVLHPWAVDNVNKVTVPSLDGNRHTLTLVLDAGHQENEVNDANRWSVHLVFRDALPGKICPLPPPPAPPTSPLSPPYPPYTSPPSIPSVPSLPLMPTPPPSPNGPPLPPNEPGAPPRQPGQPNTPASPSDPPGSPSHPPPDSPNSPPPPAPPTPISPPNPPRLPPAPPPPRCSACQDEQTLRAYILGCECVTSLKAEIYFETTVDTFNKDQFILYLATSLNVEPQQIAIQSRKAHKDGILVNFEVQPPLENDAFESNRDVDTLVSKLRTGDLDFPPFFGPYNMVSITVPSTPANERKRDSHISTNLTLVLGAAVLLVLMSMAAVIVQRILFRKIAPQADVLKAPECTEN